MRRVDRYLKLIDSQLKPVWERLFPVSDYLIGINFSWSTQAGERPSLFFSHRQHPYFKGHGFSIESEALYNYFHENNTLHPLLFQFELNALIRSCCLPADEFPLQRNFIYAGLNLLLTNPANAPVDKPAIPINYELLQPEQFPYPALLTWTNEPCAVLVLAHTQDQAIVRLMQPLVGKIKQLSEDDQDFLSLFIEENNLLRIPAGHTLTVSQRFIDFPANWFQYICAPNKQIIMTRLALIYCAQSGHSSTAPTPHHTSKNASPKLSLINCEPEIDLPEEEINLTVDTVKSSSPTPAKTNRWLLPLTVSLLGLCLTAVALVKWL
ncbi:hypothetical protein KCM76_03800 [Zooshikella marina]|uniref:hypothetical protein n=1 Tax=Zooshikella ganghwensis TaxID=202772 RepID=UPI001BAF3485|nr:hypothetical protein [Zooshikella ganghwensis]MBU2705089.1 hypothetical protein [Zooshikella ganghwensis]